MHRSGTVLAGRWRIVRHVGSGGMGTVHLAHDQALDREVAVKSVHAEPESELGRRIMREARLGASLRHPHLVTVYDVVPEGGALLLVTEYVEGETLADALRRGALDPRRAVQVLRGVAAALDHAHARGIVHRDVKPANVLLGSRPDVVKLADLGIATAADSTRITKTGGALGTVAYMAPEQFEPGPASAAVDVYALATMAFETLAGRRAFEGGSAFARLGAPPPDVRDARADLPEPVARALRRGMATDPAERPATAGAFVDELEEALAPGERPAADATQPVAALETRPAERPPAGAPASPEQARSRSRRSALVPLALLATLAIAGLLVALAVGGGDGDAGEERPDRTAAEATQPAATGAQAQPEAPALRGPQKPVDAVRQFYTGLAEGDFARAWRLAGPRFRREYGGSRAAFEDGFASLRGIRFESLSEVEASETAATVALQTVAEHTDRTERCTGTVQTVLHRRRWRVEPYGVSCRPAG